MRIVFYPDPVLQRRAKRVVPQDPGLRDLAEGMLRVMHEAHGVGLAAPQVGQALRLFVACETGEPEDAIICMNPEIEPFGPPVEMEEGCLSVPGTRAMVRRPESVRISYTGLDGVRRNEEYEELMARIIQHEFDHLEGVLFFERMSETDRLRIRPDLETLEEQYRP